MRLLTRYARLINFFLRKQKKDIDIVKNKLMGFLEKDKDYSKKLRRY